MLPNFIVIRQLRVILLADIVISQWNLIENVVNYLFTFQHIIGLALTGYSMWTHMSNIWAELHFTGGEKMANHKIACTITCKFGSCCQSYKWISSCVLPNRLRLFTVDLSSNDVPHKWHQITTEKSIESNSLTHSVLSSWGHGWQYIRITLFIAVNPTICHRMSMWPCEIECGAGNEWSMQCNKNSSSQMYWWREIRCRICY